MRIEENVQKPPVKQKEFQRSFSPQNSSKDSISTAANSICWETISHWKKTTWDTIRLLFLTCLSNKSQKKVSSNEIQYFKGKTSSGDPKFHICIRGTTTENEIFYRKEKEQLQILDISFPSTEMQQHLHSLLEHMLKEEKVRAFSVNYLNHAEKLWKSGCYTKNKIHYDAKAKDISNQTVGKIIHLAQGKRASLNDFYNAALDRIELSLTPKMYPFQLIVDFFYKVAAFFRLAKPSKGNIALADLLILLDVIDVNTRGVRFGSYGKGAVKFKMEEPLG